MKWYRHIRHACTDHVRIMCGSLWIIMDHQDSAANCPDALFFPQSSKTSLPCCPVVGNKPRSYGYPYSTAMASQAKEPWIEFPNHMIDGDKKGDIPFYPRYCWVVPRFDVLLAPDDELDVKQALIVGCFWEHWTHMENPWTSMENCSVFHLSWEKPWWVNMLKYCVKPMKWWWKAQRAWDVWDPFLLPISLLWNQKN